MIVEDQSQVIEYLSRPEAYGETDGAVERFETHISVVFACGNRAYKLKRAVRFPYLDFATAERRRHYCLAEVEINRRTAPDLYLGVVPVSRGNGGRLHLGTGGEPVDWLVEMVRFDQRLRFDRLADDGLLDRFAMESVADEIAGFHREAEGRPHAGAPAAILDVIEDNERSFAACAAAGGLDRSTFERLSEESRRMLQRCSAVIDRRRAAGRVRRGHGDLHLRNIVAHRGRAVMFDAIEFSEQLAEIDVLYDLAFLVMDLEARNLRRLASILLNRYLDDTGDAEGLAVMPLFLSLRAAIRSHVEAAGAHVQSDPSEVARSTAAAQHYLDLALAYLQPQSPKLLAIGGLSGSGKSRLARDLAPFVGVAPGARVVRTDTTRKRLARVSLNTRLDPTSYTPTTARRTYAAVFHEAAQVLRAGLSVIVDAVFALPEEREAIGRVAAECNVPFQGLWLEAAPNLLEERVTHRRHNASDATAVVVQMQLAYDLGVIDWPHLDTSGSEEATLAAAMTCLGLNGA